MKHPRIRVCMYIDENKNDDDLSQISMCSFGNCASYFIYTLFGKDVPADANIFPKKCSKVKRVHNRYPEVIAGVWGRSQLERDLNEFLWKISIVFQIITYWESKFEEPCRTAISAKKCPLIFQVLLKFFTKIIIWGWF